MTFLNELIVRNMLERVEVKVGVIIVLMVSLIVLLIRTK